MAFYDDCPEAEQGIPCTSELVRSIGYFLGMSSILCWICAQAPQILLNYRNGNADSLSPLFLMQWLLGDSTNLIGAILTKQTDTQVYTAVYFVFVDFIMCGQWLYYRIRNSERRYKQLEAVVEDNLTASSSTAGVRPADVHGSTNNGSSPAPGSKPVFAVLLLAVPLLNLGRVALQLHGAAARADDDAPMWVVRHPAGRTLQGANVFHDSADVSGYILGVVSAALYLGSRVPQIVKNFQRRSTGGLSFAMFVMAVLGNVTYSCGVFMHSIDHTFLLQKAPWIVGSVGTLCFDFTIFCQFHIYGDNHKSNKGDAERDPLLRSDSIDSDSWSDQAGGSSVGSPGRSPAHYGAGVTERERADSEPPSRPLNIAPKRKNSKRGAPISPLMFPGSKKV